MTIISGSSSAESVRKEAPNTPPQIPIQLEPIMATSEPGFDDLYPWHKHSAEQPKLDEPPPIGGSIGPVIKFEEEAHVAAHQMASSSLSSEPSTFANVHQFSKVGSSTVEKPLSSAAMYRTASAPNTQLSPAFSPLSIASSSVSLRSYQHSPASPAPYGGSLQADTPPDDLSAGGEILDIFSDDRLPGYQVWPRGQPSSSALAVRIPRQLVGWKAILMDAGNFDDAAFSSDAALAKKARRASKVLGKQGWEVRQERLKNSYDFRRGSGIWASMHGGHRLFKHEWHVIVKDGTRYVWRMDKKALALYREEDEVKVAEYRRAMRVKLGIDQT
ncbi:hypothetical protein PSEUBRA_004036 [Kalmanozyma brasiliensis GHG001]|uniref:Uncharacterized protein n=1 Tax=Kalmanozyma brasiliensis (strain GHG001) TaxID=1365824 RepID=V5EM25_KALBG|nr:uncharacterized protein PSEUBRA_004036 [Kalmanozyma brasiliensis GHG001]EST06165.1 hypothetical protein PSEUBRA_004036 [Kalmanozyma brasiliensis GHG001]